MKKIVLSLLSLTFIGLSHIAMADDLLAWAEMSKGSYVAPGCSWQAGGATAKGPIYNLVCNGAFAGTRTSNSPAPEIITANSGYYVLPHSGGSAPINGYNYAIYKSYVSACAAHGLVVATYSSLEAASANIPGDSKKCGNACSITINANGLKYNNACN